MSFERRLSGIGDARAMSERQLEDLVTEVQRYLAAVDVFRAVDCEPTWRSESAHPPIAAHANDVEPTPAHSAH